MSERASTWWLVIQSHDLLEHLRDAHSGVDPSDVLRNIYLEAEERENVRPTEEDEDLAQEREYRRRVEDDNKRLRAGLERIVASGAAERDANLASDRMTVEQIIVALLRVKDPDAIPEFTLDGETWFRICAVSAQADGNVTLEVEPW